MLEIKLLKDCWGSYSFFGYKDGRQLTEAYDTIEELIEDNGVFKHATITIKKEGYQPVIKNNLHLLDSEIIEELKTKDYTIYFNDIDCYYWIYDFKINEVWFSAKNIDMNTETIELEVFK